MTLPRRSLLLLPLAVAACAEAGPARTSFPPLHYDYLNPIGLNVATIDTMMRVYAGGGAGEVTQLAPIDLIATLQQVGADRLKAYGTSGRAEYVITEASLYERAGGYEGTLGVEVDVYPAGSSQRAGYAEARVFRRIEDDSGGERGTLYDLEKQLLDALNVELEFQVRRNLKDWLVAAPSAVPAPVNAQPLPPPS
ncbi:MAG TPA: hypothetical protein VJY39_01500 [Acidisphaera sp.]|nr:hypothetical protein [Acidisphaera sp.]